MSYSSKKDFEKLKKDLKKYQIWPSEYVFKFIISNEKKKKEELLSKFDLKKYKFLSKESSNKKYISLTLMKVMNNPDEVVSKYIDVSNIDGIISL